MDKKQERIDELLKYSSKGYHLVDNTFYQCHDLTYQKAELLFRNKAFISDFAQLKEYLSNDQRPRPNRAEVKWFFDKWEIADTWKGDKEHLTFHLKAGAAMVAVYERRSLDRLMTKEDCGLPNFLKHGNQWLHFQGPGYQHYTRLEHADKNWPPRLCISIDPWTTPKQIGELCKLLPERKDEVFGFALESKSNFARDLCWYDLQEELGLGTSEIARIWAAKKPREFRTLVEDSVGWKDGEKRGEKITAELARGDARYYIKDYIKQGLPSVVSSAINRIRLAADYLTR